MKLVLGVADFAYSDANGTGATTTGDVAEILERNYAVMATFVELKKPQIAAALADSLAAALQRRLNGEGPVRANPTFEGTQKIESQFRQFIYADEMAIIARKFGMTLSAAAEAGVNHRKGRPYAKSNAPRPAFVDTGLYVNSMRAWVEP